MTSTSGEPLVVGTYFKVGKKITVGAFGELREGKHMVTHELVAIKLEKKSVKQMSLPLEFNFYHMLRADRKPTPEGLPRILYFGPCGDYNGLVMEYLGQSLENLFNACDRTFTINTSAQMAIQLVSRLEYVHSKEIMYRDVKPENFLMGKRGTPKESIVHIVDFGLSKPYIDQETHQHIPFVEGKAMTGTARYMSINTHQGKEQSRRDDLESVGYMIMYFLKGELPWQGLQADSDRERYIMIGRVKQDTAIGDLCAGFPTELETYFHYVRSLDFTETPDYIYLKNLFADILRKRSFKHYGHFDWSDKDSAPQTSGSRRRGKETITG